MKTINSQRWCLYGGLLFIAAGILGMAASMLYLCSWAMVDIIAGASGFVAGAILAATGLAVCVVLTVFGECAESTKRASSTRVGVRPA